jgi:hypothetical protein
MLSRKRRVVEGKAGIIRLAASSRDFKKALSTTWRQVMADDLWRRILVCSGWLGEPKEAPSPIPAVKGKNVYLVDLHAIKKVVNLLLDHIIQQGIDSFPLDKQFYSKVLDDEKYMMDKHPGSLGVGDLLADLSFVEQELAEGGQPIALTLTELAPILAYVGEVAGQTLAAKGA